MIFATYTDLSGTTRLLGCPYCGGDEGIRIDLDDDYEGCGCCTCCGRLLDEDELRAIERGLEDLDGAAYDLAGWIFEMACGLSVPSPFGPHPIDGEITEKNELASYHHGASADPETA